jgi:hypothetical protein
MRQEASLEEIFGGFLRTKILPFPGIAFIFQPVVNEIKSTSGKVLQWLSK